MRGYNRIRIWYLHLGIKNRILFSVLSITVVSLLTFTIIFSLLYEKRISKDNDIYSTKLIHNTSVSLDRYFDEIASIANEANYNYYLQNYLRAGLKDEVGYSSLSSKKSMQDYEISANLYDKVMNDRTDVSSVMIFGRKKMLLYKTMYSYLCVITDLEEYNWYKEALEHPDKFIVTGPQAHRFLLGNQDKTISLSRQLTNYEDGSFLGIILIDVNLNKIAEICNLASSNQDGKLCLLNSEGDLIYEQDPNPNVPIVVEKRENLSILNHSLEDNSRINPEIEIEGEVYQVNELSMERTGWRVVSLMPFSLVAKERYRTMVLILLLFVLIAGIVMLTLKRVLTSVVNPIIILKEYMDLADSGNLHIRMEVLREDETGMLTRSFNGMLERIENLMEQVVKEQEDKRKFEMQALQAQINPHFLYNTLDSIIWMAETRDENIVPMIEALAKLFRISLNKGYEFITVSQEIEHVRNYLVIQSMRYVHKFEYQIQVEDSVKDCMTMKLIVQPIVENSIYHGIKMKKGKGRIEIRVFQDQGSLIITVSDDGIGMEQWKCRDILNMEHPKDGIGTSGVGVKNVNERIKLYFGKEYGLSYISVSGKGTVVTIKLPITRINALLEETL